MARYRLTAAVMIRNKISAGEIVLPIGTEIEAPSGAHAPGHWAVVEAHTGRLIREFGSEDDRAVWLREQAEPIQRERK